MARPDIGSRFVTVDGVRLAYTVEGTGTPLLCVGSSIYYPRTFSQDLRRSCVLACADLPHFVPLGPAFAPASITFDGYATCIEAVRIAAGLGRIVVVGHSHHGNVALEYAKRFPQHVSHVVMIGAPPVDLASTIRGAEHHWALHASKERRDQLERRRTSPGDGGSLGPPSSMDAYIRDYVADAPLYWNDPDYDAAWLWQGMTFDMEAVRAFRDLYQDYELHWDATSLTAPVLVVMGANDFAVPHTLWEPILPRVENVTFRVLDHCGHTPQLERPAAFDRILIDWVKSNQDAPLA